MARSDQSRWLTLTVRATCAALVALALIAVALHVDSSRLLSHVNGIHLLLADLLTKGTFYPEVPTTEIAYGTFYQPLAFAPLSLLPGEGLEKVRGMRLLCAGDVLLALGLLAGLAPRGRLGWPVALALCTAPVGFCMLAMRDDPRGVWLGLLAVLAHLHSGRLRTPIAALCLALAFFTKITAPFAPFCAIAFDLARHGRGPAVRFVAATAIATLVPFAILQWGFRVDLLDNGIRLAVLEPAYTQRDFAHTTWRMLRDVLALQELAFGLAPLAAASLALLVLRALRRHFDLVDALALAGFTKAWLAYRNPGADYNHLFDLALFVSLHVAVRGAAFWNAQTMALALLALLALDRPWEMLLGGDRPPLANAPAALAARDLAALPKVPTLVEDPLVQLLAGSSPRVPDCGVVLGRLRRHPQVRQAWFGDPTGAGALERMVLLFDPFEDSAEHPGPYWYGVVNFDRTFYEELSAHWHVVRKTAYAAVLERNR